MSPLLRSVAFALPLIVVACAASEGGHYPSLLPRPIEQRSDAEPVMPAATAPAVDAQLDAALAARRGELQRHIASFDVQQGRAVSAASRARGSAAGSEPWIAAQTELAGLDGERADVSALVADLETMSIERGAAGEAAYPALEALHDAAATELERQSRRITALQAQIAH